MKTIEEILSDFHTKADMYNEELVSGTVFSTPVIKMMLQAAMLEVVNEVAENISSYTRFDSDDGVVIKRSAFSQLKERIKE